MTLNLSHSQSSKRGKASEEATATLLTSDLSALRVGFLLLSLSLGLPKQSGSLSCIGLRGVLHL